jgi:hypothetical protein
MDESWKHSKKWNKPIIKGELFYHSTYIKYQVDTFIETESRIEVARDWEGQGVGREWEVSTV